MGKRNRENNLGNTSGWEFSKTNDRHQTAHPEFSDNTKQDKYQKFFI